VTAPSIPGGNGYVSNEAIWLQMKHFGDSIDVLRTHVVAELQLLRQDSVRRDVYEAERRADHAEMESVKKKLEVAEQRKWMMWVAVVTAVLALGKDVIGTLIS
jgi:hypothetical protein